MPEFIVTIEADSAPQIVLGQMLLGGTVTALKLKSVSWYLWPRWLLNMVCQMKPFAQNAFQSTKVLTASICTIQTQPMRY